MTDQEIFDTVAQHLLKQGRKSVAGVEGFTRCCYRGEEGLKCAVGVLIKDEHYKPELENKGCGASEVVRALHLSGVNTNSNQLGLALLSRLQGLHDEEEPCNWKKSLRKIAERCSLRSDVLNQF